jgi:predicted lipid-binding transport protein (Tim44 family)
VLPFDARQAPTKPESLDLNVVLPAGGEVYLRDLRVRSFASEAELAATFQGDAGARGSFWSNPGAVGGLMGGAAGILGALIGLLAYLRRGKILVQALLVIFVLGGIASLLFAAWSASRSQAFMSYYAFLLTGIILTAVASFNYRPMMRRYEVDELRRIEALDRRAR